MKLLVLINPMTQLPERQEPEQVRARIAAAFAAAGVEAEVRLVPPDQLTEQARAAVDVDAVIAAGDDATASAVAQGVMTTGVALGVLPMGVNQQFARELKMPADLDAAVAIIAKAIVTAIPIGEVNGQPFLNFAAMGTGGGMMNGYTAPMVQRGSVWRGLLKMLRLKRRGLKLSARGHTFVRTTPSVIISNNPHQLERFHVKPASQPESGLLNVYTAAGSTRRQRSRAPVVSMALPELRVDPPDGNGVEVLIDGRRVVMQAPVRVRICAKTLKVLVPSPAAAG